MPWHIEDDHPDCDGFAVVKDSTGEVAPGGCHKTKQDAQSHLAALVLSEESEMKHRAGRILSSTNEKKLREALAAIAAVLDQLGGDDETNAVREVAGIESRTFQMGDIEVREEEDGPPVIRGHAAVFNIRSVFLYGFREIIEPGAFAETLKQNDVRKLWQHDPARVLGRVKSGTLRLWEDDRGLAFENNPPDTQDGRDAVTLIGRGDVDQMSFGFNVPPGGDTWSEDEDGVPLRRVRTANLFEISPVTWPAYPDTGVSVVRSAPEWVQRALCPNGADDIETKVKARARLDLMLKGLDLFDY